MAQSRVHLVLHLCTIRPGTSKRILPRIGTDTFPSGSIRIASGRCTPYPSDHDRGNLPRTMDLQGRVDLNLPCGNGFVPLGRSLQGCIHQDHNSEASYPSAEAFRGVSTCAAMSHPVLHHSASTQGAKSAGTTEVSAAGDTPRGGQRARGSNALSQEEQRV